MNVISWGADLISRHLDTVGDGSGIKDAIGDYSITPIILRIENYNPDMDMALSSLDLYIRSELEFLPTNYGGVDELENGISVTVQKVGMTVDLTNGEPIIHTCCLCRLFHEVHYNLMGGWEPGAPLGKNWISATWKFERHGIALVLREGESIEIALSDDFTGLDAHRFMVYGYWADPKASPVSHMVYKT